ncbi:MAG: hypothetical protein LBU85_04780 [Treponema sp.]|nr:hypothetical protein [Treponema sp.]
MEAMQPKRRKGFNLYPRENKKHGFLYYVRYSHGGKMLPSGWNTHTNDLKEAEKFARENKIRLVGRYLKSHDTQMYSTLESFFDGKPENSHLSNKVQNGIPGGNRKQIHTVPEKRKHSFAWPDNRKDPGKLPGLPHGPRHTAANGKQQPQAGAANIRVPFQERRHRRKPCGPGTRHPGATKRQKKARML